MKKKFFDYFILSCGFIFLISLYINFSRKNENFNLNEMRVHFIDVGQGDSILIQVNNYNMLIDSGSFEENKKLKNYLTNLKIKKLDYLIGTHPHEDHIGNMSYVINNYEVLNFYSPKVITNSNSFEKLIDSLKVHNLKIKILNSNTSSINLGKDTKVEVFSPSLDYYENLNNYSPIMKISYKDTSILLTGDAEELAEEEVLFKNPDLKADILKVGHHGSSTSTSKDFYQRVNPSISIISVGENSYGHPTNKILNQINSSKIYRTDEDGDIILISDGISFK